MKTIQFQVESAYVDMVLNFLKRLNVNIIQNLSVMNSSNPLSPDEIKKIVENSQRIEGYEPVSQELELEVEAFMVKNNVQISA